MSKVTRQLGLRINHDTPLSKKHYRSVFRQPYDPPIEPRYWERRPLAPCGQGAAALGQLRAHHLDPGPYLTVSEVKEITGWDPPTMKVPVVTVKLMRWLLSKTHPSSPFHNGVTYRMIAALDDFVLEILCQIINCCFRSGDPLGIPQADFLALRKKAPYFFVSTCRPILNLSVFWKMVTLAGAHFLKSHLVTSGIIPPCQMAVYPGSSSLDVLRVMHDTVEHRWRNRLEFWTVFDDVVHAYGSIGHETAANCLQGGGVAPSVAKLMKNAMKTLKIYYAGAAPDGEMCTTFDAGTGQGDPWSTVVFATAYEVRCAVVEKTHTGIDTPWGRLSRVVYADDAQWPCDDRKGVHNCLLGLEAATHPTNCRSDATKTVVVGTSRAGFVVKALDGNFTLWNLPQRVAKQGEYVRVQGRHALPHIYHREDFTKLMRSCRVAASVLRIRTLPCRAVLGMIDAKTGGICEWHGGVRPPTTRTGDLFDLPFLSAIRCAGMMVTVPVPHLLCGVKHGGLGLLPCTVRLYLSFLVVHLRQLNSLNPTVRDCSRYNLMLHAWRRNIFSPCEHVEEPCDTHRDDHSRRLKMWAQLGWTLWVPFSWGTLAPAHPLEKAKNPHDAGLVHQWMCDGLSENEARAAGCLVPNMVGDQELPQCLGIGVVHDIPIFDVPTSGNWVFIHDASVLPDGRAGGGIVGYDVNSGEVRKWGFDYPIHVDNSYQGESLCAWACLRSLLNARSVCCGFASRDTDTQRCRLFHDSMSYLSALGGKNLHEEHSYLVDCVIRQCREMLGETSLDGPEHLYSHLNGTFLDQLLDIADAEAKECAYRAIPRPGWIRTLQPPCAVVTRRVQLGDNGDYLDRQTHDVRGRLEVDLLKWFGSRCGVVPTSGLAAKAYAMYEKVVMDTDFCVGDHLLVTGVRHGLYAVDPKQSCPFCSSERDHRDNMDDCPLGEWYWASLNFELARKIPMLYSQWKCCHPFEHGVFILHKFGSFAISVRRFCAPLTSVEMMDTGVQVPVVPLGHTGDVDPSGVVFLKSKGLTVDILVRLVKCIVQQTAWAHRRGYATSLPVLPLVTCTLAGNTHDLLAVLDHRIMYADRKESRPTFTPCRRWPDLFMLRWIASVGICGVGYDMQHPKKVRLWGRLNLLCIAANPPDGYPPKWESPKIFLCDSPTLPPRVEFGKYKLVWALRFTWHGVTRWWACWCPFPIAVTVSDRCFGMRLVWERMMTLLGFDVTKCYRVLSSANLAGR